jgi:transcriptional regulator GlxA family with amidase domain
VFAGQEAYDEAMSAATCPPAPIRIGLLIYPGCMPSGLLAMADMVQAANQRVGGTAFLTCLVALEAAPVRCAHGHQLVPAGTLAEAAFDALLLPPCWTEELTELTVLAPRHMPLLAAIAHLPARIRLLAYCSGVALLAASGRLNGQAATVSWWLTDLMQKHYPQVRWQVDRACLMGPQVATAIGGDGHLQLGRELLNEYVGPAVYQSIIKLMQPPQRSVAHAAFADMDLVQQGDVFMQQVFLTAQQLPATRVTLRRLADDLSTTESTLARRIAAATGLPAAGYLRRIKLHQASERLIRSSTPASAISAALGFSTETSMRRMFKDLTGLTPSEYREQYRIG